jgi:hypothetical protein
MKRFLALSVSILVLAGCQGGSAPAVSVQSPAAKASSSPWVPFDMPGSGSGGRAAVYDASRNCLWVVTRQWAEINDMSEHVTLTRVNLADHSYFETSVRLDDTGWNGAWVFVDGKGIVWMAWGRWVYSYDPDTNALKSFGMPGFDRFGLHPSFYSGDGNMISVGRDGSGELWMTFSRVAAIFGFNPALGRWDHMIQLPWFPYYFSEIASPRPGVLVLNGYRSPDDKTIYYKFAEIDISTGHLTEFAADISGYVLVDSHTVLFTDFNDDFARLDLDTGAVTVLDGEAPGNANGAPVLVGNDGYVWYAAGTGVGNINVVTGAMTRYQFPPIVFTSPVPNVCDRGPHGMSPTCYYPCPTGVTACIPKPVIPEAQIYALEIDRSGNVWAVTDRGGNSIDRGPVWPVMELRLTAA